MEELWFREVLRLVQGARQYGKKMEIYTQPVLLTAMSPAILSLFSSTILSYLPFSLNPLACALLIPGACNFLKPLPSLIG